MHFTLIFEVKVLISFFYKSWTELYLCKKQYAARSNLIKGFKSEIIKHFCSDVTIETNKCSKSVANNSCEDKLKNLETLKTD